MKRMKAGFTLAEVLITLGIIGVVAALVMPTVMTNHTYKTVGVKLQKFASQLEGSSRPYVVSNENFESKQSVADYLMDSFILTNNDQIKKEQSIDCSDNVQDADTGVYSKASTCGTNTTASYFDQSKIIIDSQPAFNQKDFPTGGSILRLKDGTELKAYMVSNYADTQERINEEQVGSVVFGVAFAPNVNGMTKSAQKRYSYVVTELGYVYPDESDACLTSLVAADYQVKSSHYATGSSCAIKTETENKS